VLDDSEALLTAAGRDAAATIAAPWDRNRRRDGGEGADDALSGSSGGDFDRDIGVLLVRVMRVVPFKYAARENRENA
jgi:hypothetical protein